MIIIERKWGECMENDNIIGIIPAGGYGTRMHPFKVWKELIHVGYKEMKVGDSTMLIPKIVGEYTLEGMVEAGASLLVLVLNERKYDVFRFFGDGSYYGTDIAYTCQNTNLPITGMPVAIDTAYKLAKGKTVFMGMPDTITEPYDSFQKLYDFHVIKDSDLTLGVFPTDHPTKLAPVLIEEETGRVLNIFDKPKETDIYNTWSMAIWSDKFTDLLHQFVLKAYQNGESKELLLSDVFLGAIKDGLKVNGLFFAEGNYHDLGDINQFVSSRISIEKSYTELV